MAPTPSPNAAFRNDVSASHIQLWHNTASDDDWDNIQDALNDLSGVLNSKLELMGTMYHSYQLEAVNFTGEFFGQDVGTKLIAGTSGTRIRQLDDADRLQGYAPGGWPLQTMFHGTKTNLFLHDLTLQVADEGVRGYSGIAFGGFAMHNMHCQKQVTIFAGVPSIGVLDESIVLNGTTPTSLANSDIADGPGDDALAVFSAPETAGTKFVEGASNDFVVDLVNGTVARTATSTIGDGATVYVTYNRGDISAPIDSVRVKTRNVLLKGTTISRGENVQASVDLGITIWPSTAIKTRSSQSGVSLTGVLTELGGDFATMKWDLGADDIPLRSWNGIVDMEDTNFEDMSLMFAFLGSAGKTSSPGGHTFAADAVDRCKISIRNCHGLRANWHELNISNAIGNCVGTDVLLNNVTTKTATGFLREFMSRNRSHHTTFLSGFIGEPNSIIANGCKLLDWKVAADQFGGFIWRGFETPSIATYAGTGDQFIAATQQLRLTDGSFDPHLVDRNIIVVGASNGANNGVFRVLTFIDSNNITINNPAMVDEGPSGTFTWTIPATYREYSVRGFETELADSGTFREAMQFRDLAQCSVSLCKFKSVGGAEGREAIRVVSGLADFKDNDFSEYHLQPNRVHMKLDSGSRDCVAQARSTGDLIDDDGTDNKITSGNVIA